MPDNMPQLVPMLSFEDAAGALDWLATAFGFRERLRLTEDDGTISHAEMELGDAVVMLATPTPDYEGPRHHREHCKAARKWSQIPYVIDGLLVQVDDVDSHFERAKKAGAVILSEPQDTPYGTRQYRVEDSEGHRWMFSQPTRAVAPEEWGAKVAS